MIYLSKENDLIFDYSQELGHMCVITITSWEKGITWRNITTDENTIHTNFLDDFELLSFSIIYNNLELRPWINKIPEYLVKMLLDYENNYQLPIYSLLFLLNRYQGAIDLFTNNPLLIAIIIRCARYNNWTEKYIAYLLLQSRVNILQACDLRGTKSTLKIFNKLSIYELSQSKYLVIKKILALPEIHKLNRLQYIDTNLYWLLIKHPELILSRLLQSYQKEWLARNFSGLYSDTLRMIGQEKRERLMNCHTIDELEAIHECCIIEINKKKRRIKVNYPAPPITGCKYIIPITNSHELFNEGEIQNNCVSSYHQDVLDKKCCFYKIIKPERATLEIRIQEEGDYFISQLKLSHNREPSKEVIKIVYKWIGMYQKHVKI